jgi:hypothetical protein
VLGSAQQAGCADTTGSSGNASICSVFPVCLHTTAPELYNSAACSTSSRISSSSSGGSSSGAIEGTIVAVMEVLHAAAGTSRGAQK